MQLRHTALVLCQGALHLWGGFNAGGKLCAPVLQQPALGGQAGQFTIQFRLFLFDGCGARTAVNPAAGQLCRDDLAVQFQQRVIETGNLGADKFETAFYGQVVLAAEGGKLLIQRCDFSVQRVFLSLKEFQRLAGLFAPLCGGQIAGAIREFMGNGLGFFGTAHLSGDGQHRDGAVIAKAFSGGCDAVD